jgi:hypothetical protein
MSYLGIAGTDENRRIEQAMIGIAGDTKRGNIKAAHLGIAGNGSVPHSAVGIAGEVKGQTETGVNGAFGISGINCHSTIGHQLRLRDDELSLVSRQSYRLGDRAVRESWRRGIWFADFTYLVSPFAGSNGRGNLAWREGREQIFSVDNRIMPVYLDSCGFRRVITETAPEWAKPFEVYPRAIEIINPDGYATWDNPKDRAETMKYTQEMMRLYPGDTRMWPVYSVRWAWDDKAHLKYSQLPGWRSDSLSYLIPETRTQKLFSADTKELWARQAIANALEMAKDPHLRWMVDEFGKVMIGGMVKGPCPRDARHLFVAALCKIFPEANFWLLGQANFKVINGLGKLGLLDRVWCDGTWWIKDATCERFAYVENGLITMLSFEMPRFRGKRDKSKKRQTFFTLTEMMAANIRSLLAAYEGLWEWPPPEPLPVDLIDINQVIELKDRYRHAQLELGL